MPAIHVPVRHSGIRYTTRPGSRYPITRPVAPPAASGGGKGILALLGGLGGLLLYFLCLATAGLLGLFAAFIAATKYLSDIYDTLKDQNNGGHVDFNVNMIVLLVALCLASVHKLFRSL